MSPGLADLPLASMFAILVIDALNRLDPDEGCCDRCCAPCGDVLKPLIDGDAITDVVRRAPEHLWGPDWEWWSGDRETGRVNGRMALASWRCGSNPPCEVQPL